MTEQLLRYVNSCIEEEIFPGCALGVIAGGKTEIITAGNLTYDRSSPRVTQATLYDVASITKAIPTSCLALKLIEEGRLDLSGRLVDYVPEFRGSFRDQVRIEHLLTHTLDFDFRLSDKKDSPPQEILDSILQARLRTPPGAVFCYANATSILLGLVIERASGLRLDKAANTYFFEPLAMRATTFFPATLAGAPVVAPSEDDPWRGRVVCGEVHDESAWALRPLMVAGSAGLFSTVPDLLRFLAMLLKGGESQDVRFFKPETVGLMHTNALPQRLGSMAALGWELNNASYMGRRRTSATFGKTGFTGCTIVADAGAGAGLVLLTNHIFPRRRADRSVINRVRSTLADIVFETPA